MSEYGQAYDIYDFEEDKHRKTYWDLGSAAYPVLVGWGAAQQAVSVVIDHSHGFAGFESAIGQEVLEGPAKWSGLEFQFHTGSEHTINGERFDLELQLYHTVEPVVAEGDAASTPPPAKKSKRLLAGAPAAADGEAAAGEQRDKDAW